MPLLPAILAAPMPAGGPREVWWRASLVVNAAARLAVTPDPRRDSSLQRPLAEANALIRRSAGATAADTGSSVEIMLIAGTSLRPA